MGLPPTLSAGHRASFGAVVGGGLQMFADSKGANGRSSPLSDVSRSGAGGLPGGGLTGAPAAESGLSRLTAAASLTRCSSLMTGCGPPTRSGLKQAGPFPAAAAANGPDAPLRVTEERRGGGVEILHSHRFTGRLIGEPQRWAPSTDLEHSRGGDVRIKTADLAQTPRRGDSPANPASDLVCGFHGFPRLLKTGGKPQSLQAWLAAVFRGQNILSTRPQREEANDK